jgi:protein disulfide-isomerase
MLSAASADKEAEPNRRHMKKTALIGSVLCLAGSLLAREAAWQTSFPVAADQATREGKLLLLDFTGSDWCGWCMRLDAETFSKPEFIDYAAQNLVLLQLDFPKGKPQPDAMRQANRALKRKYSVNGFPTIVIVKPDGTVLWQQTGYLPGGPPAMINAANQCRKAAGLAAPAQAAPPAIAATRKHHPPIDPVQPPPSAPPPQRGADEPSLQGILYSTSHPAAVLNGKMCEEGGTVEGIRVVKITRSTVTVEIQGQTKTLYMN